MNLKYKGIDLERIKQVQEINFSHVWLDSEMVQLDLKRTFSLDGFKINDSVIDAVRLQIEAHQNKHREDMEMFIICEMAKLFLEDKQKQKKVLERLGDAKKNICGSYNYKTPLLENPSHKIAFNNGIEKSIEIIKKGLE